MAVRLPILPRSRRPIERDFEKALARNIFQSRGYGDGAVRLARYARAALARTRVPRAKATLLRGDDRFSES